MYSLIMIKEHGPTIQVARLLPMLVEGQPMSPLQAHIIHQQTHIIRQLIHIIRQLIHTIHQVRLSLFPSQPIDHHLA